MHHSLLALPQILGNTGFSELLDANLCPMFSQSLLFPTALLSQHSQVPNAVTYYHDLEDPNVCNQFNSPH